MSLRALSLDARIEQYEVRPFRRSTTRRHDPHHPSRSTFRQAKTREPRFGFDGRQVPPASCHRWTRSVRRDPLRPLQSASGRRLIATGGEDRVARIWSTDGKKLAELVFHRNRIWALAFSPDGKWIATGGGDHVVGLWNAETGALRTALSGHQGLVLAATWLRDDIFVTGGSDGTLRFWRIDDTNGQVTSERTIDLGFVIRSVVAGETDDAPVIAAGRDPQPTLGSRLVRIGRAGIASEPVTGTLPGAIRAMALSSATGKLYVGGDSTDVVELDPTADIVERRRLRIDGPYSSAVFVGALGLTEGQKVAIAELGGRF